jgi:hypothetical protein
MLSFHDVPNRVSLGSRPGGALPMIRLKTARPSSFLGPRMAEKPPLPTSIRLPTDLKDFLKKQAGLSNRKLAGQIIHILKEWRAMVQRTRARI